jgi:NitT/TauT family transport system permease protein
VTTSESRERERPTAAPPTASPAGSAPVRRGGAVGRALRGALGDRLILLALVVALIAVTEVAARQEWVSRFILPAPSDVWRSLVDGFGRGVYWPHIWSTVYGAGVGFLVAAVGSLAAAGVMVASARVERVVMPAVVAFQSLPKIAVAPIVILWLGFELSAKVVIVAVVCFFPMLLNSLAGLKIRDREQYELLKSLGASKLQMFRHLRLPSALPYVFAGFHVGVIFALLGAVVAEFVGARNGLGYYLLSQRAAFNAEGVYAVLIILMVIGLAFRWVMLTVERRVAFWAEDVSQHNL